MSHKVVYGNSISLSFRVTKKKHPELFSVLSKIEYHGGGAAVLRELLVRALESGELEKIINDTNRMIATKVPMDSTEYYPNGNGHVAQPAATTSGVSFNNNPKPSKQKVPAFDEKEPSQSPNPEQQEKPKRNKLDDLDRF